MKVNNDGELPSTSFTNGYLRVIFVNNNSIQLFTFSIVDCFLDSAIISFIAGVALRLWHGEAGGIAIAALIQARLSGYIISVEQL